MYLTENNYASIQHRKYWKRPFEGIELLVIIDVIFFFYSTQRQNGATTHEVPYARLIDSPNRKAGQTGNSSTPVSNDSDLKLKTNRSIRMPTPKSSASESKLTVDYFQKSDISVCI